MPTGPQDSCWNVLEKLGQRGGEAQAGDVLECWEKAEACRQAGHASSTLAQLAEAALTLAPCLACLPASLPEPPPPCRLPLCTSGQDCGHCGCRPHRHCLCSHDGGGPQVRPAVLRPLPKQVPGGVCEVRAGGATLFGWSHSIGSEPVKTKWSHSIGSEGATLLLEEMRAVMCRVPCLLHCNINRSRSLEEYVGGREGERACL